MLDTLGCPLCVILELPSVKMCVYVCGDVRCVKASCRRVSTSHMGLALFLIARVGVVKVSYVSRQSFPRLARGTTVCETRALCVLHSAGSTQRETLQMMRRCTHGTIELWHFAVLGMRYFSKAVRVERRCWRGTSWQSRQYWCICYSI